MQTKKTAIVCGAGGFIGGHLVTRLKQEGLIGKVKYGYRGDRADISLFSEFKITVGKAINYKAANNPPTNDIAQLPAEEELAAIYNELYRAVEDYNRRDDFIFIV